MCAYLIMQIDPIEFPSAFSAKKLFRYQKFISLVNLETNETLQKIKTATIPYEFETQSQ